MRFRERADELLVERGRHAPLELLFASALEVGLEKVFVGKFKIVAHVALRRLPVAHHEVCVLAHDVDLLNALLVVVVEKVVVLLQVLFAVVGLEPFDPHREIGDEEASVHAEEAVAVQKEQRLFEFVRSGLFLKEPRRIVHVPQKFRKGKGHRAPCVVAFVRPFLGVRRPISFETAERPDRAPADRGELLDSFQSFPTRRFEADSPMLFRARPFDFDQIRLPKAPQEALDHGESHGLSDGVFERGVHFDEAHDVSVPPFGMTRFLDEGEDSALEIRQARQAPLQRLGPPRKGGSHVALVREDPEGP